MCSIQDSDLTPVNKDEKDNKRAKRQWPFAEHDLVLKIEDTKLYVVKDQLMKESPVFDRMFTSEFKEKYENEIELDGKNLSDFVDFLRCTMPGMDEDVTDETVHKILPLADEYQTAKTLKKANQFLAKKSKCLGDTISSAQVIQNILEAELYRLDAYLDESIAIASRKYFVKLVQHPKFNEITQETRLKIMTKRWEDMDEVFKNQGCVAYVRCAKFYHELTAPIAVGGDDKTKLNSKTVNDLRTSIMPFIQNN